MDAQQLTEGLTTAQTVMTVLGSMGAVEFAKYLGDQWQKRREAKVDLVTAAAKAEQDQQAADHEKARQLRRDALEEQGRIIDRLDKELSEVKAELATVREHGQDCEKRAAAQEVEIKLLKELMVKSIRLTGDKSNDQA